MVALVVAWTWIFLTFYSGLAVALRRKAYNHYLNYWLRAAKIAEMDVTTGARKLTLKSNLEYIVVALAFIVGFCSRLAPSVTDGAGSLANAVLRLFVMDLGEVDLRFSEPDFCSNRTPIWIEDHILAGYWVARCAGLILLLYALYCSRTFLLQFKFFCRLLQNASHTWNMRYKNCVDKIEYNETQEDQFQRRLTFKLLMKDQIIITNLYRLTGNVFRDILVSHYGMQMISFCFEIFYLSQLGNEDGCEYNFIQLNERDVQECLIKTDPNVVIGGPVGNEKFYFVDPCDEVSLNVHFEQA